VRGEDNPDSLSLKLWSNVLKVLNVAPGRAGCLFRTDRFSVKETKFSTQSYRIFNILDTTIFIAFGLIAQVKRALQVGNSSFLTKTAVRGPKFSTSKIPEIVESTIGCRSSGDTKVLDYSIRCGGIHIVLGKGKSLYELFLLGLFLSHLLASDSILRS
jgi:hypothetical protein